MQISGNGWRGSELLLHVTLVLFIVSLVLAPGFFWPPYFRILMTVLLLSLGVLVARAYLVAFSTFRKLPDPPAKPDDVDWPTVSVLVPAYNEATVLPRTMASMLKLDYPADRIEFVYVHEKRSTDGTGEIIRSFAARDPRFIDLERDERTGGKAAATNHGLARCAGELVFLLDADHALKPDAVKRAARHFIADKRVVCLKGRCLSVNPRESFVALLAKMERDVIEKGDLYVRHLWNGFSFFGGGQAVFRREVFDRIGRFDEGILVEDIDFSVRIHEAGYRLVVDPLVVSFEEQPASFMAWWAQRKRWARGWMQVARRYLSRLHRMPHVTTGQKVDMYVTLSYVVVPVFFIVGFPLLFLAHVVGPLTGEVYAVSDYLRPWSATAWALYFVCPPVVWLAMWLQDRRAGIKHDGWEWFGMPFFWPYLVFQTAIFWAAFLDEFVLRRPSVYVKTAKTGGVTVARATPVAHDE